MECPIGGLRCFEGCAKGNLALNYSPMSYTTEGPSVPYNATPVPPPAFRSVGSGGTDAYCGMIGRDVQRASMHARGAQHGGAIVGEALSHFEIRA